MAVSSALVVVVFVAGGVSGIRGVDPLATAATSAARTATARTTTTSFSLPFASAFAPPPPTFHRGERNVVVRRLRFNDVSNGEAVPSRRRSDFARASRVLLAGSATATATSESGEASDGDAAEVDEPPDGDYGDKNEEEGETSVSFVTPSQRVYIEDTDAYGVIYNSNYLRIYDRALHWAGMDRTDGGGGGVYGDGQGGGGGRGDGGVLTHEDWYISEVDGQKFRASPPLGGAYVVDGRLIERFEGGSREVWEVRMTGPPPSSIESGKEEDTEETDYSAVLYNSATVTVSKPDRLVDPPSLLPPKPDPLPRSVPSVERSYVPYRDEYDLHLGPTHLPLQSCLNLFERSRSDFLGGPDELRRMKDEYGLVWVVTKVGGCALVNIGHAPDEEDDAEEARCFPGGEVVVRTDCASKRGGAVIECRQTLLVRGKTRRRRLAQAVITIMALDDKTRRPARKMPDWFKEKLSGDT